MSDCGSSVSNLDAPSCHVSASPQVLMKHSMVSFEQAASLTSDCGPSVSDLDAPSCHVSAISQDPMQHGMGVFDSNSSPDLSRRLLTKMPDAQVSSEAGGSSASSSTADIILADGGEKTFKKMRRHNRKSGAYRKLLVKNLERDYISASLEISRSSAINSPKRVRVPGDTPPDLSKKKLKSSNAVPGPSRPVVQDPLQIVIFNDDNEDGEMTAEQGQLVLSCLFQALRKIPSGSESSQPSFEWSGMVRQHLNIQCANQFSLDWVSGSLTGLSPWDNAKLRIVPKSDMPKLCRASLIIPAYVQLSGREVIEQICEQNRETLSTRRWVFYAEGKQQKSGRLLFLGIDELSVKALKAIDFKPYLGLSRVLVKLSDREATDKRTLATTSKSHVDS